jgi:DNA-directed RNA polymerase specialized sigma24 family protein
LRKPEDLRSEEDLVWRHAGALLATARRILGRESEARAAVQDGFAQFLGTHAPLACLKRFVIRAALARLRARRPPAEPSMEGLLPRFHPSGASLVAYTDWSAGRASASAEDLAAVRDAVDALPGIARLAFLLCDVEELGVVETAGYLELTPMEVTAARHRARQALRTLIAPCFESPRAAASSIPAA